MGRAALTVRSPEGRVRRRALLGAAAGLLLIGVATALLLVRPTATPAGLSVIDVGTPPVTSAVGVDRAVTTRTTGSTLPPVTTAVPGTSAPTAPSPASPSVADPGVGGPSDTAAPAAPAEVLLPALGLRAVVVEVGVSDDGAMEVPEDVSEIGWYRFGPAPGATTGSAVLAGHVDSADQGRGVFADLGRLAPGDPVEVIGADGRTTRFTVVSRESWPKDQVPLDRLFDRGGPGRLVLVTCGGAFDPQARSYEENIAVTAVPA